jgi:hypothetical protein
VSLDYAGSPAISESASFVKQNEVYNKRDNQNGSEETSLNVIDHRRYEAQLQV